MLAQTNSTPDEHICSLAAYMHVHMHSYAPVLAHHYYPMHTLQYVQYDHSICNHTIIHHSFSWAFPMRKKAQTARLLALLIQRIKTQIRRLGEPGVRRLHTDQGGEFKSTSLEDFCQWNGIIQTFTDRAQHQSNGLVERKIGQLNESTRAALLASDLPAYLWPEVYMAMCHTQNIVPSSGCSGS